MPMPTYAMPMPDHAMPMPVQVLRYEPWQHYQAHHDFFDPEFYQQQPAMLSTLRHGANNRLATVFMYLTNVTGGGETAFPRAGGGRAPSNEDTLNCSMGMAVRPHANKVVIFYSLMPSGDLDYSSQHIGCDVHEGTKWAANFWLWNMDSPMNRGGRDAIAFQEALEAQLAVNASC
jgi:prolyl 4-hydroxylase